MEQPKDLYITLGRDSLPLNVFDAPTLMQLLAELTHVLYRADHLGVAPTNWRETLAGYEEAIKAWANYRERHPNLTSGLYCPFAQAHDCETYPATRLRIWHEWLTPHNLDPQQYTIETFCGSHLQLLPAHDLDIIITL